MNAAEESAHSQTRSPPGGRTGRCRQACYLCGVAPQAVNAYNDGGVLRVSTFRPRGANPIAVQTMLGHHSAVLTMDTYADLFPDDLELVSAAHDKARNAALNSTADQLTKKKTPTRILGQGLSPAITRVGWRDSNPRPLRPERHHQRLWR